MNSVGVSVVNYRTPELTIKCLESLQLVDTGRIELTVAVVDNDSQDGSADKIESAIQLNGWEDWVQLVRAPKNGGFSYGNNRAIEALGDVEFIWLLNSDTEIRAGACEKLIDFLLDNSGTGVAGSRLEDPDETAQVSTFNFPSPLGELVMTANLGLLSKMFAQRVEARAIADLPERVDWLAGASMMIRSEVIREIGLMDEEYFLYYEEVDYCFDIYRHGYDIWYVPESRVVHHVGASTGVTTRKAKAKRRPDYWFQSRHHFFIKNYGYWGAVMADFFWVVGRSTWELRKLIQRKEDFGPDRFFADFLRNNLLKH